MLINTLSFLIVLILLAWHLVRLVRNWRVTRSVSVSWALFIPALTLQLIAQWSDYDWVNWIVALLLVMIVVCSFKERSRELDELPRINKAGPERESQSEPDRKSWWNTFAVESRPKEINFEVELPELLQLKTAEEHPLALDPGKLQLSLGGWEKLVVEDEYKSGFYEIRLRIFVKDAAGVVWTSEYRVDIESLVQIGLSSAPKRMPEELHAWTEIDPEMERTFREASLVAKAIYHTDLRDWFETRIGKHRYVVLTKYQRGVIDLAWDAKSSRFMLRLAGLQFRERDGIRDDDLDTDDQMPGPDAPPWDPWEIEPVVFHILPEELLPFGTNGLRSPFRFDEKVEPWPPLFARLRDPAIPPRDSESVA